MGKWQSMGSAPKDGTLILLYVPVYNSDPIMGIGFYAEDGYWRVADNPNPKSWYRTNVGVLVCTPDYWMALPEPPVVAGE